MIHDLSQSKSDMNTKAKPKIAWVTGASSGIGRALCLRMAADGWVLAVTARNADALINLQDEAPKGSVHCYPGDVSNAARMKDIMGQVLTHLGGLDRVIVCAGTLSPDNAQNFNAERFRRTIDTNLCGTANVLDPALAQFKAQGYGHVVLVSSLSAYMGMQGYLSYGTSKAGVYYMAQALAADLSATDIKVQVITPGFVDTPLLQQVDTGAQRPMDVGEAADIIMKGLKSNRFEISFPWGMSRSLRALSWLPERLSQPLLRKLRQMDNG